MRITILGIGDLPANPRVRALERSLTAAGNDVTVVSGGEPVDGMASAVRVPSRVPEGGGMVGGVLRRLQPRSLRQRGHHARLASVVADLRPEIIYVLDDRSVPVGVAASRRCGAAVYRGPSEPGEIPNDLVWLAPQDRALSSSAAGRGVDFHTADDRRPPWVPRPGRHAGVTAVVVHRDTETTPARYLRAALERAGVRVVHAEALDGGVVPSDAAFVVVVESPLPALRVRSRDRIACPVLFWAHHGEHHTGMHLRLIERYGPDAVLLAHSWHLAHRYPVPVHRFPFAIAPELVDPTTPWGERTFDVAFAGSIGEGEEHDLRRRLLHALTDRLDSDRVAVRTGIAPEELAGLYGDARIVVNDGGTRHRPITMRVFEGIGSGCLLATTPAPGLSLLLPDGGVVTIGASGDPEAVIDALDDPVSAARAARAREAMSGRHTYDHRVDELIEIASLTTPAARVLTSRDEPIARAVSDRADIDSVAAYGLDGAERLLSACAVWVEPAAGIRRYDAVVIGPGAHSIDPGHLSDAVRYVVADLRSGAATAVVAWARSADLPMASDDACVVVDREAPGYRITGNG